MVYSESRKQNSEFLINICDFIKINGEIKLGFSAFLFSNFALVMVYREKLKEINEKSIKFSAFQFYVFTFLMV